MNIVLITGEVFQKIAIFLGYKIPFSAKEKIDRIKGFRSF